MQQKKIPLVRYSDEELEEFKQIILDKLAKAKKDFQDVKESFSNPGSDTSDTAPTFKIFEEGRTVFDKEEKAKLAGRLQKYIRDLEAALTRIENKTYGICSETGKLIPKERLRIVPHTTKSIEAKNNRKS